MAKRSSRSTTRTGQQTFHGVGDRRTLERFKLHTEIFVQPLDGHYSAKWVVSEDISHRGMFICTDAGYPLDTIIALKIHSFHGCIEVTGKVVHQIQGVGFGCRFLSMSPRNRADLSFLVSNYYSAPPPRRKIH